ncbi:MAG: hypothetical protein QXH91_01475 [Candidatus Bathyarchaeia archaeon]
MSIRFQIVLSNFIDPEFIHVTLGATIVIVLGIAGFIIGKRRARDATPETERILPDLLNLPYEYFFKMIGNDNFLPYQYKCVVLVLALYVPGVLLTILTGTIQKFITVGWGFFFSNVLIGIVVWALIGFLRKANDKIVQVSRIICPVSNDLKENRKDNYRDWQQRIEKYKEWAFSRGWNKGFPPQWYYFDAIAYSIGGLIISKFVLLRRFEIAWIQDNLLNELYYIAWYTALGFIVGVCMFYAFGGFWIIRRYCKDVISEDDIKPLDPDHTGGLKELGRLSLDLDLVIAFPSLAFLIYLPQNPQILSVEVLIGLSLLYCLTLMFIFFISLSPAHNKMVNAKIKYLLMIHNEYREMHEDLLQKLSTKKHLEPMDFERLEGLYKLYDRVEKMAVWPLDYRILLRFLLTSVLPLIASVITVSLWP